MRTLYDEAELFKKKGAIIAKQRHLGSQFIHPLYYSHRFFFGNNHFSKANSYLKQRQSKTATNWELPLLIVQ